MTDYQSVCPDHFQSFSSSNTLQIWWNFRLTDKVGLTRNAVGMAICTIHKMNIMGTIGGLKCGVHRLHIQATI
jgi:hypothetical protein